MRDASETQDEGAQEYDWAKAHAAEQSFGRVRSILFPFSQQLMAEIRRSFPVDVEIYDAADATRSGVEREYLSLRLGTFALFVIFTLLTYGLALLQLQENPRDLIANVARALAGVMSPPEISLPITLAIIAAIGVVCAGLRTFWRWALFREIDHKADAFAHTVSRRYQEVLRRVVTACQNAEQRGGDRAWPERARRWVRIAVWNGKRGEYLDRYSTTVAWKIRIYLLTVEAIFWVLKGIVAFAFCAAVIGVGANSLLATLLIAALYLAATGLVWFWLGRRKYDFWTDAFIESMGDYKTQIDYIASVSKVTENLVHHVIANEWNPQAAKTPPATASG